MFVEDLSGVLIERLLYDERALHSQTPLVQNLAYSPIYLHGPICTNVNSSHFGKKKLRVYLCQDLRELSKHSLFVEFILVKWQALD